MQGLLEVLQAWNMYTISMILEESEQKQSPKQHSHTDGPDCVSLPYKLCTY